VIVDLRRVTEIDSTGRQILTEIRAMLDARGITLLISGTWPSGGADGIVEPQHAFGDIDRAMEFAEDALLNEAFREVEALPEIAVDEIGLLDGFEPGEIAAITARLRRTIYPKGLTVFEQGAPGHEIFFIARGHASVRLKNGARDIRLMTFTAGTVFGELALLDKGAFDLRRRRRGAGLPRAERPRLRRAVCRMPRGGDQALVQSRPRTQRPPAPRQSGDPAVGGVGGGYSERGRAASL
jgi:hypothetical protein